MICERCRVRPAVGTWTITIEGRTMGPWDVCADCLAPAVLYMDMRPGVPGRVDDEASTKPIDLRSKP